MAVEKNRFRTTLVEKKGGVGGKGEKWGRALAAKKKRPTPNRWEGKDGVEDIDCLKS